MTGQNSWSARHCILYISDYTISLINQSCLLRSCPTSEDITLVTRKQEPLTMATYGKISEYDESELWTQYVERLEQYFVANDVKEPKKQWAIFLSVCGAKTYALVRDLLQPKKPAETDLDEILKELDKHFSPKPSEIVERFTFHNRRQGDKESVAEFIAGLKKLTEHCNFGDTLNAMLRDRLVCGIKDGKMLAERHETHPGVSRMKVLPRSYVWWPNMDKDVEGMVRSCKECQVHQKALAEAPRHPWEWPGQPWSRIHIDYAGPYKK